MFNFFRKRRIKKYIEEASTYVQQKYVVPVQPPESNPIYPDGVKFSISRTRPGDSENKVHYSDRDDGIRYRLSDDKDDGIRYRLRDDNDDGIRYRLRDDKDEDIRYSDREPDNLYREKDEPKTPSSDVSYSLKEKPSSDVRYSLKEKPSKDHYNASAVSSVLRNYSTARNYNEMLKTLEQNVNQTFVDKMLYYINAKGVRDSEVYKAAQVDKRLFSKIVSNNEYKPSKDTAIALALALELSLDEASDLLSRAGYTFSHSNKRDIIIEFFFREKVYNLIDVNEVLFSLNQKLIGRF